MVCTIASICLLSVERLPDQFFLEFPILLNKRVSKWQKICRNKINESNTVKGSFFPFGHQLFISLSLPYTLPNGSNTVNLNWM